MNMKRIALALSTAAVIGTGYFSSHSLLRDPSPLQPKVLENQPRKFRWRKGHSWISDGRLHFSYALGKKPSIRSIDIRRLHINPGDILAYEPGEKQSGILITKTRFLYVKGAEDAYFSSEGYEPEIGLIEMEKDVSELRDVHGDFVLAQIVDGAVFILTEKGAFITNRPDKSGWIINQLLDLGKVDPKDAEIIVNGERLSVRIGPNLFERGPAGIFRLRNPSLASE